MEQTANKAMTPEQRAIADAALTNRLNVIHHAYVDITGDLVAGALLGQILYWFGADRNGKTRARIIKEGHYWIAKARGDWWGEIRISPKQYDRAAKILKDKGYIEVKTFKFNGNPTTHIRIKPQALNAALDSWKWDRVSEAGLMPTEKPAAVGFSPLGDNHIPQTGNTYSPDGVAQDNPNGYNVVPPLVDSLTETTAKTTNKNTAEHTHTLEACVSFADIWEHYPKKEGRAKAQRAYIQAIKDGENPLIIMVQTVLYNQYVNNALEHGTLEWRYIPTGGAWFYDSRWLDDVPSISSSLGYDSGLEYNRIAAKITHIANSAGEDVSAALDSIKALITALPY